MGQRAQTFKNVAEAEAVLQLADKLQARGQNVGVIVEEVRKATVQAAKSLNILLADEEAVEIDGTAHPVTPDAQRKLIQGRTILTLRDMPTSEGDA